MSARRTLAPRKRAFVRGSTGWVGAAAALVVTAAAPTAWAAPDEPLSPVVRDDFLARAPSPQWDVGLTGGIAGVSQSSFWQTTEFYGRVTGDVTFLRQREADWAFGGYASLATVGFLDTRPALGLTLIVPVIDPVVLELAAGGLVQIDGRGASPGFEASLGFGLRALNMSDHYGLTHTLVLGVQHTAGDDPRASTAATLGFRVDGFWFLVPFGALL